ncbi:MNIO family bufferin maturase [Cognaticolwellia mytili]|uniref:MNIO family bufferin maturase n=1 Tax=Cognaticolwellia mytili TaxID=1888913 RepID=UPI001F1F1636|nr:DUF692 domain-containing protein [Cognaticolwellia mytili]
MRNTIAMTNAPLQSASQIKKAKANLGLGLGLRSQHFNTILQHKPEVDWFEIISENFIDSGGRPRHILRQIAEHYPIVMHGVSLSIGSTDALDLNYLTKLKQLIDEIKPAWVSDHLCWTGAMSLNTHDLLPLPLTEESLAHVINRVHQVQDILQQPLVLENPSSYLSFTQSTIPEWEFFSALISDTGCGMLLDVNNVYVSAFNNDFDPVTYIKSLPHHAIVQMHLAGHQHCGDHIVDTHDSQVTPAVWQLFNLAWQLTKGCATSLEWDGNIPTFEVYHQELLKAKQFMTTLPDEFFSTSRCSQSAAAESSAISNPIDFIVHKQNRFHHTQVEK